MINFNYKKSFVKIIYFILFTTLPPVYLTYYLQAPQVGDLLEPLNIKAQCLDYYFQFI